ncbi:hypothetical protein [Reyranella sp.]|uniref:hypothetical protein n=1 Tax=Reyranella sp. TaxID=1929291 RepID=UPI003D0A543E
MQINSKLFEAYQEIKGLYAIVVQSLADVESSNSTKLFYNSDYDLIYPWLWPGAHSTSPQYDRAGRNIFSLLMHCHKSVNFKICFTVPSILEFLDTVEHRFAHFIRISDSRDYAAEIISAFQASRAQPRDLAQESSEGERLKRYIGNLQLGSHNTNLRKVVSLFNNGVLSLAHEHTNIRPQTRDPFSPINHEISKEYLDIYDRMKRKRGRTDTRPDADKMFHYKVDSWNIAFRLINSFSREQEFLYVCRPQIRSYFGSFDDQSVHSRNPLVPLYQLFAAFQTPENSEKVTEIQDFLRDARARFLDITNHIERKNDHDPQAFSQYFQRQIGWVQDTFVRPLVGHDFNASSNPELADRETADKAIDGPYSSVTRIDEFRDRLRYDATQLKVAAHAIADIAPLIVEDRLLEPYNLSNDARVQQILQTLNID